MPFAEHGWGGKHCHSGAFGLDVATCYAVPQLVGDWTLRTLKERVVINVDPDPRSGERGAWRPVRHPDIGESQVIINHRQPETHTLVVERAENEWWWLSCPLWKNPGGVDVAFNSVAAFWRVLAGWEHNWCTLSFCWVPVSCLLAEDCCTTSGRCMLAPSCLPSCRTLLRVHPSNNDLSRRILRLGNLTFPFVRPRPFAAVASCTNCAGRHWASPSVDILNIILVCPSDGQS